MRSSLPNRETQRPSRWRFVPLGAAAFVQLAAMLTFGLGWVLGPAALAATAVAYRRTEAPRAWVFWLGAAASAVLAAVGLFILVAVAYEELF